uniref:Uncharacterized protein n=1 Tax=Anguilla anguilla TaxID=7936 RepID=A0A0E9PC06_ANGAN
MFLFTVDFFIVTPITHSTHFKRMIEPSLND